MTLLVRLKDMMSQRPRWYQAMLAELADRLRTAALEQTLAVGDAMPSFVLPNAAGELVASADLLARGPLVVCFVRGGWCPFCSATLGEIEAVLPAIEAAGASLVALTPDTLGYAGKTKTALALRFELLSDVDCAVGLQFGTVYRVPDTYREALHHFGTDLLHRHGDGPGLLPMPATFVCGCDGIIRFAQASPDITERTEPTLLPSLVRALASAGDGGGVQQASR